MLPSIPLFSRRLSWVALSLILALAPASMSAAATMSLSLLDPDGSGFGANIILDDGAVPGSVTVALESTSPLAAPQGLGDLLYLFVEYEGTDVAGALDASGADVDETSSITFPGQGPNLLVNIGEGSLFTLNGITSTSLTLDDDAADLTLASLVGAQLLVAIGFDGTIDGAPGEAFTDDINFIKVSGKVLPVVPEPSTALLMLLGLSGLTMASRKPQA